MPLCCLLSNGQPIQINTLLKKVKEYFPREIESLIQVGWIGEEQISIRTQKSASSEKKPARFSRAGLGRVRRREDCFEIESPSPTNVADRDNVSIEVDNY